MNNTPNFFCVGAQKAGTSWLYHRLQELPGFSMPYVKELHYFDRSINYPSPSKWSKSLSSRLLNYNLLSTSIAEISSSILRFNLSKVKWMLNWHFSHINDKWYKSLFNDLDGISGDITPAYSILDINDIKKMYMISPNAKIIFILRNPIDRAISHLKFYHQIRGVDINDLSYEEIKLFLDDENQCLRSDYLRIIENYCQVFSKSNILIGFYDAIIEDPYDFLFKIVDFLGGDTSKLMCDNLDKRTNVSRGDIISSDVKSYVINKYADQINQLSLKFGGYCEKWEKQLENLEIKDISCSSCITMEV